MKVPEELHNFLVILTSTLALSWDRPTADLQIQRKRVIKLWRKIRQHAGLAVNSWPPGAPGQALVILPWTLTQVRRAGNKRKLISSPPLFSPAVPPIYHQGPFKMLVTLWLQWHRGWNSLFWNKLPLPLTEWLAVALVVSSFAVEATIMKVFLGTDPLSIGFFI